jgi:hypothetical protein
MSPLATPRLVPCPKCGREVQFTPAPTQREDENALGAAWTEVPDWAEPGRLSPPAADGRRWLLVPNNGKQSYWPAPLNCEPCRRKGERDAVAWNTIMGRRMEDAL